MGAVLGLLGWNKARAGATLGCCWQILRQEGATRGEALPCPAWECSRSLWKDVAAEVGGCSCLSLTSAPVQIEAVKPREILEAQQPVEVEEILPVQETLLRGQPVAQEDGKESRIAEQEKL